jgi:hypothetical protein
VFSASTSSSGHRDGLGRRSLAFDREDGTMLERLVVRPELAAFEPAIRERFEKIAGLDDERIARPRAIERDGDGALVVISEFVPGMRLDDLLFAAQDQSVVAGVDVALGFLQDVLPALCGFHAATGFAHGAIAPSRITITPAGQVVLLDGCFGGAFAHLQYTRKRLCAEFGISMPPATGKHRFDAGSDIAQIALAAAMIAVGRPLREYECLEGLTNVMSEVVDVAAIRSTSAFADALQRFLQRALPLGTRRDAYAAADDALIDVRDTVRQLGVENCRPSLVEFVQQVESASGIAPSIASAAPSYFDDSLLDADPFVVVDDPQDEYGSDAAADEEEEDAGEEINLDEPVIETPVVAAPEPEPVEDYSRFLEDLPEEPAVAAPAAAPVDDFSSFLDRVAHEAVQQQRIGTAPEREPEPVFVAPEPDPEPVAPPAPEPVAPPMPEPVVIAAPTPVAAAPEPVFAAPEPVVTAVPETDVESEGAEGDEETGHGSRRRRQKSKSVRSRKDKLRSVAPPPGSTRGAVQQLDAAAVSDGGDPDGASQRHRRTVAHRPRQQHLHADWPRRPHRACGEERHSDRRVRAPARGRGCSTDGRGPRSMPAAPTTGLDDVPRVHHGRRAACGGNWCWR